MLLRSSLYCKFLASVAWKAEIAVPSWVFKPNNSWPCKTLWDLPDPTKSEEMLPSAKIAKEDKFSRAYKPWLMVLLSLVKLPTWKHNLRINLREAWFQTFWIGSAHMRSWNWSCDLNLPRRYPIGPMALYTIIPSNLSRWPSVNNIWQPGTRFQEGTEG